jgi:hypothetical protein
LDQDGSNNIRKGVLLYRKYVTPEGKESDDGSHRRLLAFLKANVSESGEDGPVKSEKLESEKFEQVDVDTYLKLYEATRSVDLHGHTVEDCPIIEKPANAIALPGQNSVTGLMHHEAQGELIMDGYLLNIISNKKGKGKPKPNEPREREQHYGLFRMPSGQILMPGDMVKLDSLPVDLSRDDTAKKIMVKSPIGTITAMMLHHDYKSDPSSCERNMEALRPVINECEASQSSQKEAFSEKRNPDLRSKLRFAMGWSPYREAQFSSQLMIKIILCD